MPADPGPADAARIGAQVLGAPVNVARFGTGAQHFVFEAVSGAGARAVIRLSRAADRPLAVAALAWSERLRPLGLPLPRVLAADTGAAPFPWIALERLAGTDLGDVFESLTPARRRALAVELAALGRRLDALPDGRGFGFTLHEAGPFPHRRWTDVVLAELARARTAITEADVVPLRLVDRVEAEVRATADTLDRITPRPFLHDLTTRNVIIDGQRLSGIVDVDDLCYGDPLYLPGLIAAILEGHGLDRRYAADWLDALGADTAGRARAALYARVHAVGLLREIGQRFNRATPLPAGTPLQHLLEAFLARPPPVA